LRDRGYLFDMLTRYGVTLEMAGKDIFTNGSMR